MGSTFQSESFRLFIILQAPDITTLCLDYGLMLSTQISLEASYQVAKILHDTEAQAYV